MTPRARLLTKIFDQGFRTPDLRHDVPPPVVTLEEFFEGNTDPQSIAPNLDGDVPLEVFFGKLKAIRARDDVREVFVNIYDLSSIIFGDANGWPMAENVHVLTSASEDVVQGWAADLQSDGAVEGWPYRRAPIAAAEPEGFRWWAFTWD
jgi:hypothetical protein